MDNYCKFWLLCNFEKIFGSEYYLIANVGSFVCATLFAFITNKYFVFESHSWEIRVWVKEMISFVMSRIVTFLIIEEFGLFFWYLFVEWEV